MATRFELQRLLARNTLILFLAQAFAKITGFVSLIILANYLGVEPYGAFSFALAFASLFIPLTDLGIDPFLTRELAARQKAPGVLIGTNLVLKVIFGVFALAAITVAISFSSASPQYVPLVILAGIIIVIRAITSSFSACFRGGQRMGLDAQSMSVGKLAEILLILLAVLLRSDLFQLFQLLLVSSCLQLLYTYYVARKNAFLNDIFVAWGVAKELMKGGLPFALTGVAVTIYFHIDTVMLSFMVGEHSVGIYRAAYNIVFAISGFSAAVVVALFPMIAYTHTHDRESAVRLAEKTVFFSLVFSLPIAVGALVLGPQIIDLLYKTEFADGGLTLQILGWWLPVMYVTNVLGHILGAIKLQKLVLMVSSVNAVFNVVANLILIPQFADKGAAMATVLTEVLGLSMLSYLVVRNFGRVFDGRRILRLILATCTILPLALLAPSVNVMILITLGAFIYIVSLFALKVLTRDDMATLRRMFLAQSSETIITP